LKEKGWISKMENGTIAITVGGVDRAQTAAPKTSWPIRESEHGPEGLAV
jgi:hypothetical protein